MNIYILPFILGIVVTGSSSCSGPKEKLAGKWIVTHASLFDERLKDSTNFASTEDYRAFRNGFEMPFEDAEYNFKEDGTVSFESDSSLIMSGKWEVVDGGGIKMNFDGDKEHYWTFYSEKVEIFADSSLGPQLQLGGGTYLELTLKPAPGHTVKPDYP